MAPPIAHDLDWAACYGAWIEDTYDPDAPPVTLPDTLDEQYGEGA